MSNLHTIVLVSTLLAISSCSSPKNTNSGVGDSAILHAPRSEATKIPSGEAEEMATTDTSSSPSKDYSATSQQNRRSSLRAGSHNDNEQFIRYLDYLQRFSSLSAPKLAFEERYIIQLKDARQQPIPNCLLTIRTDTMAEIGEFTTSSSGEVVFFPNAMNNPPAASVSSLKISGDYQGQTFSHRFSRGAEQVITITTSFMQNLLNPLPLDIVLVIDTTGSMSDEIQQLKDTLYSIHHRITNTRVAIKPRFGMVLYRDVGDEYVTKRIPLTGDIENFQQSLDAVTAGGGGDYPEAMEQALAKALTQISWNPQGLRLLFLISDAPPHFERQHTNNYIWAMKKAAAQGIKIYPVGASGLNEVGEYIMRQLAIFTQGHYLFLTYGEQGESSSSPQAKVSHHTGSNYQVVPLDHLIVRMIKKELSYLVNPSIVREEEIPLPISVNASSLNERIHNIVEQLYYQLRSRLQQKPMLAIFPLRHEYPKRFKNIAEYIKDSVEEELQRKNCKLLEREEVETAFRERMAAAGNTLDEKQLSEITKVTGADIFLSGKIYPLGESVVLFMQFVDVDNLRKLAVARVLWTPE